MGPVILVAIVAVLIMYFFGFTVFLWCALAGGIIGIGSFFYVIFRTAGGVKSFLRTMKWIWKGYLRYEAKFFKWLDNL
jgi:hypothetical protein